MTFSRPANVVRHHDEVRRECRRLVAEWRSGGCIGPSPVYLENPAHATGPPALAMLEHLADTAATIADYDHSAGKARLPDLEAAERARPTLVPVESHEAPVEEQRRLRAYSLAEVIAEDFRPSWLIEGWWPAGSYGMLAGQEKALKSYLACLMALAVASGRDFLGKFPVRRQGPVVVFTGEGSRHLLRRRLEHLAPLVGVEANEVMDLPIRIIDDVAPVLAPDGVFLATLNAELAGGPALVILDPLYTYHGSTVDAGNVHAVGELLAAMGGPCMKAGAALAVVNHFAKAAGTTLRLAGITQAGSREWADSWWLVGHREPPDVEAGAFKLEVHVGSRQGGGGEWDIDLTLGALDVGTFAYLDDPTLTVAKSGERKRTQSPTGAIFDVLHDQPFTLTKTQACEEAVGRKSTLLTAFDQMAEAGHIVSRREARRKVWGLREIVEEDPEAGF